MNIINRADKSGYLYLLTININEVNQILEGNETAGSSTRGSTQTTPEITLDISDTITSDLTEGQTKYYGQGNNMKVTKGQSVSGFDFYIHSLATGGSFTLSTTVNNDGTTSTLPGPVNNVFEVYFYRHSTSTQKGALKIKTSSATKIFHSTTITDNSTTWSSTSGSTTGEQDLDTLVTKIKEDVEIKADKTTY